MITKEYSLNINECLIIPIDSDIELSKDFPKSLKIDIVIYNNVIFIEPIDDKSGAEEIVFTTSDPENPLVLSISYTKKPIDRYPPELENVVNLARSQLNPFIQNKRIKRISDYGYLSNGYLFYNKYELKRTQFSLTHTNKYEWIDWGMKVIGKIELKLPVIFSKMFKHDIVEQHKIVYNYDSIIKANLPNAPVFLEETRDFYIFNTDAVDLAIPIAGLYDLGVNLSPNTINTLFTQNESHVFDKKTNSLVCSNPFLLKDNSLLKGKNGKEYKEFNFDGIFAKGKDFLEKGKQIYFLKNDHYDKNEKKYSFFLIFIWSLYLNKTDLSDLSPLKILSVRYNKPKEVFVDKVNDIKYIKVGYYVDERFIGIFIVEPKEGDV
jgi:hypothetical protein